MRIRILFFLAVLIHTSCGKKREDKVVILNYFPNGQIKEEIECNKDSIPNGHWKQFYPDGKLELDLWYENGRMNGEGKTYYESGNLENVGSFIDGQRIGHHTYYYDRNNKIQAEVDFVLIEGKEYRNTITEYDSTGVIKRKFPRLVLSAERDSLVVEMKDNQFEFMTLVVGEYDSLYNLVGKKQLDTVDVKGFKGVIPLNRYSYRSVIRGFAKNYHWIKFESTRRLSEGRVIYFEYRRD